MSALNNQIQQTSETGKLKIGLFGFGVVAQGLYEVLSRTPGFNAEIKKICIKHPDKTRSIPSDIFTDDPKDILNDEGINTIVELIDDADAAFHIVVGALQKGKQVVSANKKMIAQHFETLQQLQKYHNSVLLYEAACCASIPIIRNLEEYYDNDTLTSIRGIVNGSTNFILSKMFEEQVSFEDALLTAQQLGFAESNPDTDVDGHDAANKLSILLAHAFGRVTRVSEILFSGIRNIQPADAVFANEKNLQIKFVATAQKINEQEIAAFVLPQFVSSDSDLYAVRNEFNGLITESSFADQHFYKGKGAGALPTAAAVLSDLSALRYQYKYEYKKITRKSDWKIGKDYYLKVYVSAPDIHQIVKEDFEWIEEWHNEYGHSRAIGIIHIRKLLQKTWWRENSVSLILCENPFVENVDYKKISKRSLELAGVF